MFQGLARTAPGRVAVHGHSEAWTNAAPGAMAQGWATTLDRRVRCFIAATASFEHAGRADRPLVPWLKLHLRANASTGEIAAHVLTDGDDDDAVQAPALLRQCEGALASVIADGIYDRDPVYRAAATGQPGPPPKVVIPPRADAVLSAPDPDQQTPRDRHVQLMAERGRIGWQRATGYGRRNHAETTMGRYKHLIGAKLRARSRPAQLGEVALAVQVLNRMIREARPVSVRR